MLGVCLLFVGIVLINNGFVKAEHSIREKSWTGREIITLDVYSYEKA